MIPSRPTPTASGPITQTPTPTPVTLQGFQQLYQDQLGQLSQLGISEQDYRHYVELGLLADKVRQAIASTVPTITEQIQFRYIRADTTDVPTVTQSIQQDGFANVYHAVISGTYPITAVTASETLDWVPMEEISATAEFGPTFAKELFATPVSQTMSFVANQAGTASYVAQVLAKGVEPLSSSFLSSRLQQAVGAWLQQRRDPSLFLTWEDRVPTTP